MELNNKTYRLLEHYDKEQWQKFFAELLEGIYKSNESISAMPPPMFNDYAIRTTNDRLKEFLYLEYEMDKSIQEVMERISVGAIRVSDPGPSNVFIPMNVPQLSKLRDDDLEREMHLISAEFSRYLLNNNFHEKFGRVLESNRKTDAGAIKNAMVALMIPTIIGVIVLLLL